ncbi:MAG: hypothetical protein ACOC3D_03490 [Pseudomonadota bacterium]
MTARLAPARLEPDLAGRLPGMCCLHAVRRLDGGQSNPTFELVTDGPGFVPRNQPDGPILPSALLRFAVIFEGIRARAARGTAAVIDHREDN